MMLSRRSIIIRTALAAFGTTLCLAQMKAPEARRPAAAKAHPDLVTNWPTPLFWQPGPSESRTAVRTMHPEAIGTPAAESGSTLPVPAIYVAVTPCRVLDTGVGLGFTGAFGPPALAANTPRMVPVSSSPCGVPPAVAYSVNITAVPPPGKHTGYVKAWADDQPEPETAVLNDTVDGAYIGESAIVPAGADGGINVLAQTASDLVIDINGYFALPSTLPMALGAGTVAAPALTFGTDPTTGLFSTGAGTLSIATGGATALSLNSNGDLDLKGSITKGNSLFLHNLGPDRPSTSTALGLNALAGNQGYWNTAVGNAALQANTIGNNNTATGYSALSVNTVGGNNTAVGTLALQANLVGQANTAMGSYSLVANTSGKNNTAVGAGALGANTSGTWNAATGNSALASNTTGESNTAMGNWALQANETGNLNTATGASALANVTTSGGNTAMGYAALYQLQTGSANTALGMNAGRNATTGSYSIFIANQGTSSDTNLIRIGDSNQHTTFIAGISGVTTGLSGALPVVIDTNGQLGTVSSSRRVKRDIADMGDTTETLMSLRPVQFRYTVHGPNSPLQYGLIAEEVAESAPDLVARKANGEVETVFYDKVNAMLLNQVQQQQRTIEDLRNQNQELKDQFATALRQLESRLATLEGSGSR